MIRDSAHNTVLHSTQPVHSKFHYSFIVILLLCTLHCYEKREREKETCLVMSLVEKVCQTHPHPHHHHHHHHPREENEKNFCNILVNGNAALRLFPRYLLNSTPIVSTQRLNWAELGSEGNGGNRYQPIVSSLQHFVQKCIQYS